MKRACIRHQHAIDSCTPANMQYNTGTCGSLKNVVAVLQAALQDRRCSVRVGRIDMKISMIPEFTWCADRVT